MSEDQRPNKVEGPSALDGLHERLRVDTSEHQPVYLLMGRNRNYIRLSSTAYHLLLWRSEGETFEAMADRIGSEGARPTPEEVERAYEKVAADVARIESAKPRKRFGFLFELPLLPEVVVQAVARRLTGLFHPLCVGVVLTLTLLVLGSFLHGGFQLRFHSHGQFWAGYGLLFLSIFVHEFGHATACARFGQPPSAIGFTIYLVYPALYSDVSSAWRLSRWQRVVVDVGGFYFQFAVAALYAGGYMIWGWDPLRVAVLGVIASATLSLNPIFRMDGYWVVADALGVTNLGDQPGRILRHLWGRLLGRPVDPLPWPRSVFYVLVPFTVATFAVWSLIFWKLGPNLVTTGRDYPQEVLRLVGEVRRGASVAGPLYTFLMKSISLGFMGYLFWRMLLPLWASLRSVIVGTWRLCWSPKAATPLQEVEP